MSLKIIIAILAINVYTAFVGRMFKSNKSHQFKTRDFYNLILLHNCVVAVTFSSFKHITSFLTLTVASSP